jgi:hypothetical protein
VARGSREEEDHIPSFHGEAVNFHLAVAFPVNNGNFKKIILTDENKPVVF